MELFLSWNTLKFLGALSFIFITAADDSIWLIPLITGEIHSKSQQFIHIIVFISILQLACFLSWIACILFGYTLEHLRFKSLGGLNAQILLQIIGVILTWCIALYFFLKKLYKKVRSQQSQVTSDNSYQHLPNNEDIELSDISNIKIPEAQDIDIKSTTTTDIKSTTTSSDTEIKTSSTEVKIGYVIMMTFVGALDEMLCFPSFLLGNVYSIQELSAGCLVASIILILILLLFYQLFKPLFDFFDRIPLYAIISIFAIIQTVNLFYDLYY